MKPKYLTRRGFAFAGLAAAAGCAAGERIAPDTPRRDVKAFVGVTVLSMGAGGRLLDQTVLVEGSRIVAIEPRARTRVPEGAQRLGRPGQVLIPGLADMHVHIQSPEQAAMLLANGVTTARNMWGYEGTLALARAIETGEAPGPWIHSTGALIDGPNPIWPGAAVAETPEAARQLVRQSQEQGFPAIKLYARLSAETFTAAVAEARRLGLRVYCHVPESMSLDHVIDTGVDSIEHLDAYEFALNPANTDRSYGGRDAVWAGVDEGLFEGLAHRLRAAGVWSVPTLIVRIAPARGFADFERAIVRPEARFTDRETLYFWRMVHARSPGADRQLMLQRAEAGHAMRLRCVRALHDAGAGLMIGTDMPNPFVFPGASMHEEMQLHVEAGLRPDQILPLVTSAPARFLGQEGEFGAVTRGARADLLLLDADPERDLAALRAPSGVMAAGRWYDASSLAQLKEDVARRVARAGEPAPS